MASVVEDSSAGDVNDSFAVEVFASSSLPSVSVVIPCHNDAKFLKNVLADLAAQTCPANQVLVVDNVCTDESVTVARSFGATVICEPVKGIWPAAAAGFRATNTDLVFRVDADSRLPKNWLEQAVGYFVVHPNVDFIVGPGVFYGGGKLKNWLGTYCYIGLMTPVLWPILGHPPLFGSNMGFRRSAWLEVQNLVHSDSPIVHDDLDLSFCVRPWMQVHFLRNWKVGVSARPFATWAELRRRLHWVGTTWQANWPESKPFRHRHERKVWQRQQRKQSRGTPAGFSFLPSRFVDKN